MNDYLKYSFVFDNPDPVDRDIMSALLCDAGFESFVATERGLDAYIPRHLADPAAIAAATDYPFKSRYECHTEVIEGRDWNEEWERNYFTPTVIGGRCVIHSSFHTDFPKLEIDIVIDPKMAFGTGHHQTTCLMAERLLEEDIAGRSVVDVGTGTGILAILASKLGASECAGIEIDQAAYLNARENAEVNGAGGIRLIHGDASDIPCHGSWDYLLANINRNIITADMGVYAAALRPGGKALLSGFYNADVDLVAEAAAKHGLRLAARASRDDWAAITLVKA